MANSRNVAWLAVLAAGLAAPALAATQPALPFASCPSLDAIQAAGGAPSGTGFPCLGIATFTAGTSRTERAGIVTGTGAVARFDLAIVNGTAVLVPNERALMSLVASPSLVRLFPDRRVHAFAPGGNKGGGGGGGGGNKGGGSGGGTSGQVTPSGVLRIGAVVAHDAGYTGSDVRVAIVDTGIDLGNTDLDVASDCFYPQDSAAGITSCQDDNGHGTHVAGIVAALDNDHDVVGVAPGAQVVAVKVLGSDGAGYDSEVVAGLQWARDHNIQVVNMSLGETLDPGTTCDDTVYGQVLPYPVGQVTVVVAAAGNDYTKDVSQMAPAGCTGVISVASTAAEDGSNKCIFASGPITEDTASYFTTNGATIAAPGERSEDWNRGCAGKLNGILSLQLGGGTTEKAGTSMAAPHVAGVAALLFGQDPSPSAADVEAALTGNTCASGSGAPYTHPISGATGSNHGGILSASNALGESCTQ